MDTAKPADVVRMERPPLPATFAGNQPLVSASELARMPIGLRIMFDPATREYFEDQARRMADPRNRMVPNHCHDDVQLCFSIITDALNWNMIPQKVAMATYNVHNKIGYEGKLIRAIMLNSGFVTEIKFEHGPNLEAWEKVEGRFNLPS